MIRQQVKAAAKEQIRGKIGILFVITLIMILLTYIPVVGTVIMPGISLGICMIYVNLTYGKDVSIGDMFQRLKALGKAWWLSILVVFFTYLWSLLFVIPGIIKGLSYSMSTYVLAEHPEMTARQALNESKRLMKGHVGELFVLELSFIGWFILCLFTLMIPMIYVAPYMNATLANYYQYLKQVAQPEVSYQNPQY